RLDDAEDVFTTKGLSDLIRSECLGIRAMCHFDLLRLFGPVPGNTTAASVLPYVKTLSKTPHPHLGYEDFKAMLMEDLREAEALSKEVDPFLQYSASEISSPGGGSGFNPESDF